MTAPLWQRTRANRARWIADIRWAKRLPLADRLKFNREPDARRREFLPVRPIWRFGAPGAAKDAG